MGSQLLVVRPYTSFFIDEGLDPRQNPIPGVQNYHSVICRKYPVGSEEALKQQLGGLFKTLYILLHGKLHHG